MRAATAPDLEHSGSAGGMRRRRHIRRGATAERRADTSLSAVDVPSVFLTERDRRPATSGQVQELNDRAHHIRAADPPSAGAAHPLEGVVEVDRQSAAATITPSAGLRADRRPAAVPRAARSRRSTRRAK